jgi:SRSO17 transposase
VKDFTDFFRTRSDSNLTEIRGYLFGLMQAKRGSKNMERMEEHVPDFAYQNVHHSISDSPWDHRPLMDEIARRADGLLGGAPRCRLVVDDTGIQKKGDQSVGVARQYIVSVLNSTPYQSAAGRIFSRACPNPVPHAELA